MILNRLYELAVRDHGLATAVGLLARSLPYALARFAILFAWSIACIASTVVAFIFGIVVYFYGIAFNIPKFSEGSSEKLRIFFFWGIIIVVVMVSVFGIVRLMRETVFGGTGGLGSNGQTSAPCSSFGC